MSINAFDSSDEAIRKTIIMLCRKLERVNSTAEHLEIVESIAKLRNSLNAPVYEVSTQEILDRR
jgi:hypothetical protein